MGVSTEGVHGTPRNSPRCNFHPFWTGRGPGDGRPEVSGFNTILAVLSADQPPKRSQ